MRMGRIKRFIGLLMAACLCLGTLTLPVTEAAEAKNPEFVRETELLSALDILEYQLDASRGDAIVTRAQMYGTAMALMGRMTQGLTYSQYTFADAAELPEANRIQLAVDMGLLEPGWFFNPEAAAGYQDTVRLLVSILGYKEMAEFTGSDGWGYLAIGSQLGVTRGTGAAADGSLTWGTFTALLCNTIDADAAKILGYYENGTKIVSTRNNTVLSIYSDIYKLEGVVEANARTALKEGVAETRENDVILAGETVCAGNTGLSDMIGYSVSGYAKLKDGKYTALYFRTTERNQVWRIDATDLLPNSSKWSAFCIAYQDMNGRERHLNLPSDVSVIYNGKRLFDYSADDLNVTMGSLTVVDYDRNGRPDVVFADEYVNYIVESVSAASRTVQAKNSELPVNPLVLSSEKVVRLIGPDGTEYPLEDLTEYTVLSISASKDGQLIRGDVTKEKVSGQVTALRENDGRLEVTMDLGSYKLAPNWYDMIYDNKPEIKVGEQYTMYLDKNGDVAAAIRRTSGTMYAFMIGAAELDAFQTSLKFRVFTENASWEVVECKEHIYLNGKRTKLQDVLKDEAVFRDGKVIKQMVKVVLDNQGRLSKLYTPIPKAQVTDETDEDALISYGSISGVYKANGSYLGQLRYGLAGLKIFALPMIDGEYDEENFDIVTTAVMNHDENYTISETYDWTETHNVKVAMIPQQFGATGRWNNGALFVKYVATALIDDEVCKVVVGMNKGVEVTYTAQKEEYFDGIKSGDILAAHVTNNQLDAKPVVFWNINNDFARYSGSISGTGEATQATFIGTVIAKDSLAILVDDGTEDGRCVPMGAITRVTICDTGAARPEQMFRPGTVAEVGKGANVILYSRVNEVSDLIVLED